MGMYEHRRYWRARRYFKRVRVVLCCVVGCVVLCCGRDSLLRYLFLPPLPQKGNSHREYFKGIE